MSSTDDVVMRLVDVRGALDSDPGPVLGLTDHGRAAELTALLDGEALGLDARALKDSTPADLLAVSRMDLVTDRRAPGA